MLEIGYDFSESEGAKLHLRVVQATNPRPLPQLVALPLPGI